MSDSGSIETWAFLDDDDEASAPGGAPLIPIIVTLASPEVPLTTANLTSHAGSVKSGGPDAPEDESITSSAFELLDEEEQDEILAMGRLQRRAEYSAARSEGRSARRAITTGPNAVGMLVSTLSKLQIGMAASCAARNTTHSSTRPTPVVPAAPENDLVFARALAAYLRSKTEGTPEVRGLRGWQILAQAGGVTVISNSIPEIIRAIKAQFVNLYDVLSALETGSVAKGFAHAGALALHTFHNGKTMPKSQAKAKQMLKVFLKELN